MSDDPKAVILAYAQELKRQDPTISASNLREQLEARFARPSEVNRGQKREAINNPFHWLLGLQRIFRGLATLFDPENQKPNYGDGLNDIIEGVLKIVTPEEK